MLLNVQELQSYLQCAFDHFALTLDEAFDFVQASFINNPIPEDFGGNILRMAIKMMQQQTPRPNATAIFEQLSSMIASCIMLDSVRHEIRGKCTLSGKKEFQLTHHRQCGAYFPRVSRPS